MDPVSAVMASAMDGALMLMCTLVMDGEINDVIDSRDNTKPLLILASLAFISSPIQDLPTHPLIS